MSSKRPPDPIYPQRQRCLMITPVLIHGGSHGEEDFGG